ncbi:MAG: hypothetical protein ACREBY_01175 [Polaromonas sp.]
MKHARAMVAMLLAGAFSAGPGWSQGNPEGVGPRLQSQDACRSAVSKFEQAIGLVRQASGQQVAADLKERLLPAKLENDILFKDGYCGLARYLHDKKLNR